MKTSKRTSAFCMMVALLAAVVSPALAKDDKAGLRAAES